MEKYKGKYRIPSARLQTWDYGNNGMYFITICTQNRAHYFGEITDFEMKLSEIGIIAEKYWYEIPEHFPFVHLGEFVVMPNHVHGIIIIDNPVDGDINANVETRLIASLPPASPPNAETKIPGGITGHKNPMIQENISRIMRWYKGRCSFEIRKINPDFEWQPRFHDHIIRNNESFEHITSSTTLEIGGRINLTIQTNEQHYTRRLT